MKKKKNISMHPPLPRLMHHCQLYSRNILIAKKASMENQNLQVSQSYNILGYQIPRRKARTEPFAYRNYGNPIKDAQCTTIPKEL